MKVKIKGLVFVGFAAAILSANAMAAATDANTVTSKAYTEATYQKKVGGGANANKLVQATAEAGTLSYVTIGTTGDSIAENNTEVVTGNAVNEALNTVVDNLLDNSIAGGDYTTATYNSETGITTVDAKATTDGTLANADSGETDFAKLPTAGAVKTYADSKVTVALSNTTTEAPSGAAVTTAVDAKLNHNLGADNADKILVINSQGEVVPSPATGANTYQSKSTDTTLTVADGQGGWTTLGSKVNGGTYVTATPNNDGTVAFDVTGSQITQSYDATNWNTQGYSDNLTTEAAVAGAINAATGGTVIPAMNTSVCNATTPCALVADEANGKVHWRTMATATEAGGACGDVGGCE